MKKIMCFAELINLAWSLAKYLLLVACIVTPLSGQEVLLRVTYDANPGVGVRTCSAVPVAIDSGVAVITVGHAFWDLTSYSAEVFVEGKWLAIGAKHVSPRGSADFAVLSFVSDAGARVSEIDNDPVEPGDRLTVGSVLHGRTNATFITLGTELGSATTLAEISTDREIVRGDSGSPVFRDGRFIGVLMGGRLKRANYVPISEIIRGIECN